MESRQPVLSVGMTSSRPPRPCARMETANCTRTLGASVQDVGASNPTSEASRSGQSGRLEARSSTIFTWSPSSTATLRNFPVSSPRWCLTTSRPGAATSSTKAKRRHGTASPPTRAVPRPNGQTPRWMPARSTAGDTRVSAVALRGSGVLEPERVRRCSGRQERQRDLRDEFSSRRRLAQNAASTMASMSATAAERRRVPARRARGPPRCGWRSARECAGRRAGRPGRTAAKSIMPSSMPDRLPWGLSRGRVLHHQNLHDLTPVPALEETAISRHGPDWRVARGRLRLSSSSPSTQRTHRCALESW